MKYFISLLIYPFLILIGCKDYPTGPSSVVSDYISLHVGDIRQLHYIYSPVSSIYTLWKITGITLRSDSLPVFISEWHSNKLISEDAWTEYNFIRDGFYYSTLIDSSSPYKDNPFWEEKLAEVNPHSNDTWLHTPNVPDSLKEYIVVKYIGDLKTPIATFKNVYAMDYSGLLIYYTQFWGYIGTADENVPNSLFIVNYMKINGKEIGQYVEMPTK